MAAVLKCNQWHILMCRLHARWHKNYCFTNRRTAKQIAFLRVIHCPPREAIRRDVATPSPVIGVSLYCSMIFCVKTLKLNKPKSLCRLFMNCAIEKSIPL